MLPRKLVLYTAMRCKLIREKLQRAGYSEKVIRNSIKDIINDFLSASYI